MVGEIPDLNLKVNLDTSGVSKGVSETESQVKQVGTAATQAGSKFSDLKNIMLGTFAGAEIQRGIQQLTNFLKESVKAAEEAQASTARLATAMNNAKVNTDANREAVTKTIEKMEGLGFAGNSARQALGQLITTTGNVSEASKLMGVAADYARMKHVDLATAATVLSRGTVGAARAFREYGITLDTTLPKNEAIKKAFDELNQKIGGQAQAYLKTYAGQMELLHTRTEALKEGIGGALLPVLTKFLNWLMNGFEWLQKHKEIMTVLAAVIGTVLVAAIGAAVAAAWSLVAGFVAAVAPIAAVAAGIALLWNHSEKFRKVAVEALKIVIEAFGYLLGAIGKVVEGASHLPIIGSHFKGMAEGINKAATEIGGFSSKLDGLKDKKIDIKLPTFKMDLGKAGATADTGPLDITGLVPGGDTNKGAAKASEAAKKQEEALQKAMDKIQGLYDDYDAALQDRQDKMDAAKQARDDARAAAEQTYREKVDDLNLAHDEAIARAKETYQNAMDNAKEAHEEKRLQIEKDFADRSEQLLQDHQDKLAAIQKAAEDKVTQLEQQAADKRLSIINESIAAMTSAWQSATKIDLKTIFKDAGSGSDIAAALQDQLDKVLNLQKDVGQLAAKGYSQSFIDQVIAQGPDVGDKMAKTILDSSPEVQDRIKSLYDQVERVSDTGMDALARSMNDGMHFATKAMSDAYKQVSVDLQKALADNAQTLAESTAKENELYTKAVAKLNKDHEEALAANDKALKDAQFKATEALQKSIAAANLALTDGLDKAHRALTDSLAKVNKSFDDQIKAISDATMKKLDDLMAKISQTAAAILALGGTVPAMSSGAVPPAGSSYKGASGSTYVPAPISGMGGVSRGEYASSGAAATTTTSPMGATQRGEYSINVTNNIDTSLSATDITNTMITAIKHGMAVITPI